MSVRSLHDTAIVESVSKGRILHNLCLTVLRQKAILRVKDTGEDALRV